MRPKSLTVGLLLLCDTIWLCVRVIWGVMSVGLSDPE